MRPLVVLSISNGWGIRNFVHTGLVDKLTEHADVAIACTDKFYDFFESMVREGKIKEVVSLPSEEGGLSGYLRKAKKLLLQANHGISTAKIKSESSSENKWQKKFKGVGWSLARLFSSYWQIRLIERVEMILSRSVETSFSKKPEVFVNCGPFDARDNKLQRHLSLRGVKTIAIIPSWDNPSTKGCIYSASCRVLVWSEHQKTEILTYYPNIAPDDVRITGIPQFDAYRDVAPNQLSRSQFFSAYGIPVGSKVILYATCSEKLFPDEPSVVESLVNAIDQGLLGEGVFLLVRCHPADRADRYMHLSTFKFVALQAPSRGATETLYNWLPPEEELKLLSASLKYCDICINTASTMTLDALACGKPVINIGYEPCFVNYERSVARYYNYHHYIPIVDSSAVPLVRSDADLITEINGFLKTPDMRLSQRNGLIQRLCHLPENGSVNEIVAVVLECINLCEYEQEVVVSAAKVYSK